MPVVVSIARCSSSRLSANRYGEVGRPELLGGEPADALAVHRELHRAGAGNDLRESVALDDGEHVGGDRLDLRHDDLRSFLLDQALQRRRRRSSR